MEENIETKNETKRAITKTQIVLGKEIYTNNVKQHFRNKKAELLKEKDLLKPVLEKRVVNRILTNLKDACPEFDNINISDDDYGRRVIRLENNVEKYNGIVRNLIKTESFIAKSIDDSLSSNNLRSIVYLKFETNTNFEDEPEMIEINEKLHQNCVDYKQAMYEIAKWEIEAVGNMHLGVLKQIEIEAAMPSQCPI